MEEHDFKSTLAEFGSLHILIGKLVNTLDSCSTEELGTKGPSLIKAKIEELKSKASDLEKELTDAAAGGLWY